MIYIFSPVNSKALGRSFALNKIAAEIIPLVPKGGKPGGGFPADSGDQVYLDISGLSAAEIKKAVSALKKIRAGFFWGIIDPKGISGDPASFFFEGASDYIGRDLFKNGLTKKRLALAFARAGKGKALPGADNARGDKAGETSGGKTSPGAGGKTAAERKKQNLPAGKFEGWKSIRAGTKADFFFLFVSLSGGKNSSYHSAAAELSGKSSLGYQLGEAAFTALKQRLRELLRRNLMCADALLWMETENTSLFLIPPLAANGRAAVEAALKMILNNRLINLENLGLSVAAEFTFALHYGDTIYHAPGETGKVISESVNYIFHLGTKKAESGRLTVSGAVSEDVIPQGLLDLFGSAGSFEEIPVRHSRRFARK